MQMIHDSKKMTMVNSDLSSNLAEDIIADLLDDTITPDQAHNRLEQCKEAMHYRDIQEVEQAIREILTYQMENM